MKKVNVTNAGELKKIDKAKPYAFEILAVKEGEIVCTDYITTAKQFERFINNYVGEWLHVYGVRTETNTAVIMCVYKNMIEK